MYCTIHTTADAETIYQAHNTLAEAEEWGRNALEEGGGSVEILTRLRTLWAEEDGHCRMSMDQYNGVRRGADYPATL